MAETPFYIHDKITPRPAKFVRTPTPENFKTTYHRHKYWDEEIKRWHEGYGGLSGLHYFYLQEGWIQDNWGMPIRPHWRECDEVVLDKTLYAFDKGYDSGVVKRREFGLTCIGAGLLPFYFIQTNPGCHVGMTSCDLDRISKMFNEKTLTFWENLHPDISLPKNKLNQTKNNSYLSVLQQIKDNDTNQVKTLKPDVFCTETVKNPSAFSVARMLYVFLDEFPLHTNRQALLDALYPTLEKGMMRIGKLLWGGTVEEGISIESLNALRNIVSVEESVSKTVVTFIPAWMGMTQYKDDNGVVHQIPGTENGWDNEQFATDLVLKERERLDKLDDKTRLQRRIKNYPLTLDEVLESSGKGKLPEEIALKVELRSRDIRAKHESTKPTYRYDLEYDSNGNLEAKLNSKGKHFITELPNRGLTSGHYLPYIAGEDPIPYGDADFDDGSSDCLVIKNRIEQRYVAFWMDRNMDAEYSFHEKRKLQQFFFGAPNMLEMNRGEVVFQKYKDNNSLHLLAKKPMNLGIKYETSRKYGWYKNRTGARANEIFLKFLYAHVDKQNFLEIMQQLEVFLLENTDIVDAMIGCELFDEELRKKVEKQNQRQYSEPETVRVLQRDPSGKVYYAEVPMNYRNR